MLDATQIKQDPDKRATAVAERTAKRMNGGIETDNTPPPNLVRLHNPQTGIQIRVRQDTAARLISDGAYREGSLPA